MNRSLTLNFVKKYFSLKKEIFISLTCIIFYFLLWVLNPGNKVIAASFVPLILIIYLRLKDIRVSILFAYLTSIIISTGKYYLIELIPPDIYQEGIYPLGHITAFVISPPLVLCAIMSVFLIRDLLVSKLRRFNIKSYDYVLFAFYVWIILSDVVGSNRPEISLLYSLAAIQPLILYIFIRNYVKNAKEFILLFVSLICVQIFFESVISLQQFMEGSPIFKNIEAQVNVITFGFAQDELQYRFRPTGTFRHANLFGLWMSFWLSIIFVTLYKKRNWIFFSLFVLGLTSLVTTLSRSAWLGFIFSIMFCLYILEKVKRIKTPEVIIKHSLGLSIIFLVLFIFFVLPRVEKSLYSFSDGGGYFRYAQVQEALPLIIENPVFGVGSAMSVPEGLRLNPEGYFSQNPLTIHNWYLVTLAEHGIPSLILFLLFVLLSLRRHVFSIWREKFSDNLDYIRLGLIAGVFSLLIIGLFQPYIGDTLIVLTSAILGLGSYEKS